MNLNKLKKIAIFSDLDDKALQSILDIIILKKYEKNEFLCYSGHEGNSLFIIKKGKVKIIVSSDTGKENIVSTLSEGDFFGEMALFDEHSSRSASIQAIENVEAYIIYKEDFFLILKNNFDIVLKLLSTLNDRIRRQNKKIELLTYQDVTTRFFDTVDNLIEKYGIHKGSSIIISISLTHQELANMAGVSRESVSRTLTKLRKDEIGRASCRERV